MEAARVNDRERLSLSRCSLAPIRTGAWLAASYALQGRHEEATRVFDVVLATLRPNATDRGFPDFEREDIASFANFLEERGLIAQSEQFRALLGAGG